MTAELIALFSDLDLDKLRVQRPSKFVFLCGGTRGEAGDRPTSLRDYIYRTRKIERTLKKPVVLAEKAVQLYRDTSYTDLISFEEDIARISSLVLVIAESSGSLAELGAFATNETIRKSLRVILQEKYSNSESFIRFGPIKRVIEKGRREYIGFYPWRISSTGRFIQSSARYHYREIHKFIAQHLDAIPSSELYKSSEERSVFYIVYWVIYLALAVAPTELYAFVSAIHPLTNEEVRDKLYCMELAGWIRRYSYSGKDYFFVLHDQDPFDYAFKAGVAERDSIRRKFVVSGAMSKIDLAPLHVRTLATQSRRAAL